MVAAVVTYRENDEREGARFAQPISGGYYFYRYLYRCDKRRGETNSDSEYLMSQYPLVGRSKYPISGTTHTYYDYEILIARRRYLIAPGGSAAAFRDFFAESLADAWRRLAERYYEFYHGEKDGRVESPCEKSLEGPPGDGPPPRLSPDPKSMDREYVKEFERRRQGLASELGGFTKGQSSGLTTQARCLEKCNPLQVNGSSTARMRTTGSPRTAWRPHWRGEI